MNMVLSFLFFTNLVRPKPQEPKAPVLEREGICSECSSKDACPSDCFFKSRY